MTSKTGKMFILTSVQYQHFQNPKALRLLGRRRWSLAHIHVFYWSRKQSFEFRLLRHIATPWT